MANPDLAPGSLDKPLAGEYRLEQKKTARERKAKEDKTMADAKRRDHGKCRWPGCAFKDLRIETAHLVHRGMGGNPAGDRTERHKLIAFCLRHHQAFDRLRTIDVEPLDAALGTDWLVAFYRLNEETGRMEHFATEKFIGVSETRT